MLNQKVCQSKDAYLVLIEHATDNQVIRWFGMLTLSHPRDAERVIDLTISDQPSHYSNLDLSCDWNIMAHSMD